MRSELWEFRANGLTGQSAPAGRMGVVLRFVLKGHGFSRAANTPQDDWALAPEGVRLLANHPERSACR
jgi:hypothetical protein